MHRTVIHDRDQTVHKVERWTGWVTNLSREGLRERDKETNEEREGTEKKGKRKVSRHPADDGDERGY